MCGIAGVVYVDRSRLPERAAVERMNRALRHRGPDSEGMWIDGGVALAHRRLKVIDLSPAAEQPMPNEDGSVRVVYNGEIYNFEALRRDLETRGHRFRSHSDTEVLVHLYEEHGDGLLERIDGMFAFALYDARRHRLLLARDRVGKKPLKYALRRGGLCFASELKALVRFDGVRPDVDPNAVDAFLSLGYVPSPGTGLEGISKLPAGHKAVFEGGRLRVERYWSLDFREKEERPRAEWIARVREGVERAVERRLVADVPLGAFLSGGIDSSIVVACMARAKADPVETFSIGFEHEAHNELPHAREIAVRYGTNHHEFVVRADDAEWLPKLAAIYEEPYADPSALPSYFLCRETRRHVTVALSGDGGDEGFCGYDRYARQREWERRRGLLAPLRPALGALRGALAPGGAALDRRVDGLIELSSASRADRYAWLVRLFSEREKCRLYTRDFAAKVSSSGLSRIAAWMAQPEAGTGPYDPVAFADLCGYLPDDLMVKIDMASMAHGLETRAPLLDHHVLELAARFASAERAPGGALKGLLKEAFADVFPPGLLDRPKQGFGLPLQEWFRGPLLPFARDVLLARDARLHALLERSALAGAIDDHIRRRAHRGFQLWALVMLELWLREGASAVA